MQAIWKPANGYENYSVSSFGEVRREISTGSRTQKLLKQYKDRKGYMYVCLSVSGKVSTVRVHRLVADAFIGPAMGLTVNHIDLNKTNNNLLNLEYLSNIQNLHHAIENGHKSLSNAKLSEADAVEIRRLKALGIRSQVLSEKYGVTKRTIDRVVAYKLWNPIGDQKQHPQLVEP